MKDSKEIKRRIKKLLHANRNLLAKEINENQLVEDLKRIRCFFNNLSDYESDCFISDVNEFLELNDFYKSERENVFHRVEFTSGSSRQLYSELKTRISRQLLIMDEVSDLNFKPENILSPFNLKNSFVIEDFEVVKAVRSWLDLIQAIYRDGYENRKAINPLRAVKVDFENYDIRSNVSGGKSQTRTSRVLDLSMPIAKKLLNDEFKKEEDLVNAFKEVNSNFITDKPMLRPDGTAYEKRVCLSCVQLFELENPNETIDWTIVRDGLKSKKLGISQMRDTKKSRGTSFP